MTETLDQPQSAYFIPHGGGPCFFMDDPLGAWIAMGAFLATIAERLPRKPDAIIVVSAHWETQGFAFTGARNPGLIYDYYGFPPHTYELTYAAPGAPELAQTAAKLLQDAGIEAMVDEERGLDHGVFVPLKVIFPAADIPVVEMSLDRSLDPALHLAAGEVLAELRDQNILLLGSGMSFHNMRGYRDPGFTAPSVQFDTWLDETMTSDAPLRTARLARWAQDAPHGQMCHPREEHLIPAMVVAGACRVPGERVFSELVLDTANSGFRFD